jgi:hypothetical protein
MLSHQETMNPGTTLFIVIGVIGLMLYLLKALRVPLKENFTSEMNGLINNNQIADLNSLLSTFGTPDLTKPVQPVDINAMNNLSTVVNPEPSPSLSISASVPAATAIPAPSDNVQMQAPVIPNVSNFVGEPKTVSDLQGAAQKEAFETEQGFRSALDPKKMPMTTNKSKRRKRIVKKCPPMPDMSLYIRKDQIPCWGCVLK